MKSENGAVAYIGGITGLQPQALRVLQRFFEAYVDEQGVAILGDVWNNGLITYSDLDSPQAGWGTWTPAPAWHHAQKMLLFGDPSLRIGGLSGFAPNRINDVAVFRPTERKWYYDYEHDGSVDSTSTQTWGHSEDIAVAGDFDRDGRLDDVAVYRPSNSSWHYDYDHDSDTDQTSGPWGGGLPLVGDFDRDGFVDDLASYNPALSTWCYDYDHDLDSINSCDDGWGIQWGQEMDRPFVGDFDRDGFLDDVALFHPDERRCSYDYDHDGSSDKEIAYFTSDDSFPIAADFDGDGYVDDIAFFMPGLSLWLIDYDHDNSADEVSEWTEGNGIPLAGVFDD